MGATLAALLGSAAGTAATWATISYATGYATPAAGAWLNVVPVIIGSVLDAKDGEPQTERVRRVSEALVHAPPQVAKAYGALVGQGCVGDQLVSREDCRALWAQMIQDMREEVGNDWLNKKDIIPILWGPGDRLNLTQK
jgi:hypothetical protein